MASNYGKGTWSPNDNYSGQLPVKTGNYPATDSGYFESSQLWQTAGVLTPGVVIDHLDGFTDAGLAAILGACKSMLELRRGNNLPPLAPPIGPATSNKLVAPQIPKFPVAKATEDKESFSYAAKAAKPPTPPQGERKPKGKPAKAGSKSVKTEVEAKAPSSPKGKKEKKEKKGKVEDQPTAPKPTEALKKGEEWKWDSTSKRWFILRPKGRGCGKQLIKTFWETRKARALALHNKQAVRAGKLSKRLAVIRESLNELGGDMPQDRKTGLAFDHQAVPDDYSEEALQALLSRQGGSEEQSS